MLLLVAAIALGVLPMAEQQAPPVKVPAAQVKRWVDWQVGSVDGRYRWIKNSAGVTTSNQLQHKQSFKVAFKFDPQGRYSVQTFFGSGANFVSSWDNLGPGMGTPEWPFAVRQLYLQAQPAKGIEAQWGGTSVLRGEHTEITTFDNDNYLIAGRVSVKRPKQLWLDELSVTAGYLGDLTSPNVFRRFDRWDEHNYTQVLGAKKFGKHVSVTADWTDLAEISTLRQAVRVATKPWLPVDVIRFENYERVEGRKAYGFTLSAEKTLHPRLAVVAGLANIDEFNGVLSGDRYFRGKRVFVEPRITIVPELILSFFYGEAFDNDFPVTNAHRFDIVVAYNVIKGLQRAGAW